MNEILINPNPPSLSKAYSIGYRWDPAAPNDVVHLSVVITHSDGSIEGMSILLECPTYTDTKWSLGLYAPEGASSISVTDVTHNANLLTRLFVP